MKNCFTGACLKVLVNHQGFLKIFFFFAYYFRMTEYVDHLHEHMESPCMVENGSYKPPLVGRHSIANKCK